MRAHEKWDGLEGHAVFVGRPYTGTKVRMPGEEEVRMIIECAGGQVVDKLPVKEILQDLLLVVSTPDAIEALNKDAKGKKQLEEWSQAADLGPAPSIISSTCIFDSIMRKVNPQYTKAEYHLKGAAPKAGVSSSAAGL